jgi:7-cyano-7-deazaguanine synthase
MARIVQTFSGGMDSATLLWYLSRGGHELRAIGFDYGQRHKKELQFASKTAADLGVPYMIVSLDALTCLLSESALTNADVAVPDGHYAEESMKITVVPNRNMIMLAVAVGYAENLGYDAVAIANHTGDHTIYPDCRPAFVEALDVAARLATYGGIRVLSPFKRISKTDIVAIGHTMGVDYGKTWSCYKGGDVHCGTCGTCVERQEALDEADGVAVPAALDKVTAAMNEALT